MTVYLTEEQIFLINVIQIETYNPSEQVGIKEPNALNMCIEQPKQEVFSQVLYPTIMDKAAILYELLVNKHCFYNGNKRTAAMALYTFLDLNGFELSASNQDLVEFVVSIAELRGENKLTHQQIVEWITKNSMEK